MGRFHGVGNNRQIRAKKKSLSPQMGFIRTSLVPHIFPRARMLGFIGSCCWSTKLGLERFEQLSFKKARKGLMHFIIQAKQI